jgi:hypothetical protein
MGGYYNMAPGSLQDLQMQMALLDKVRALSENDLMTGGPGGRFMETQRQKGYNQSAGQLENFLKIAQAYPSVQPTPQVQQAGNVLTGGPLQQIGAGMGVPQMGAPRGQSPLVPAMSPWLNKTQSEIDAYKMKAPVETQVQYDQMKKLMDMLAIPEASRPEYMLRSMGVSREPGQKTEHQKETYENRKQALIKQIGLKKIYDPTTLSYTPINNPKDAMQVVSQVSMQYGLDVNDPDITKAIMAAYPAPTKKEGGFQWPWAKKTETAPTAQTPKQAVSLPKSPKLQGFVKKHQRNQAFYDQAMQQGYSEEEVDAFLAEKGIQ